MTTRRLAGLSWAGLILVFYYRRAWLLVMAGPAAWDVHGFFNGGWRLPWPWAAEAASRAAHGFAGAIAVFAAAWLLGDGVLRLLRCRPGDTLDEVLFRLAAGFGALSYLSLALAAVGWYRPPVVGALVIALALAGASVTLAQAATARRRGRRAPVCSSSPQGASDSEPAGGAGLASRLTTTDVVVSGVALLALGLALAGALAPEKEYDALWYHLWLPSLWLGQGHPVDVLSEYIALYPLTWELLYGNAMTIGGVVAAKLLHFACLPLLAAATWQLTRRLFPSVSGWLAAAVLVTTPTVLWEATTAYIDLALALYVTLGFYALLVHLQERDTDLAARWFRLAALCLALAAAIKHLGLVAVALAGAGLVAYTAAAQVAADRPRRARRYLVEAIVLGLAAVAVASPWYWRAWSASGNPFFPELFSVFGAQPPERWDAITEAGLAAFKAHFGYGRSLPSLLLLPWTLTQHAAAFGGSLGPVFLIAAPGVVAVLYTGLKARATTSRGPSAANARECGATSMGPRAADARERGATTSRVQRASTAYATASLVFLMVAYVAVWASPVSSFQLRFLIPVVPIMSVLAALGLTRLLAGFGGRAVVASVLGALLALNLPPFISLHEGDRHEYRGWLTHVMRDLPFGVVVGRESEDRYLRREVATYGAWRHLATSTPPSPILVLEAGGGDNLYATQPKIPADATLARGAWAEGPGAPDIVRSTMARLGITHVLFDRTSLREMAAEGAALASPGFRQTDLALEYEDARALLYRAVPTTSSARHRSLRPN